MILLIPCGLIVYNCDQDYEDFDAASDEDTALTFLQLQDPTVPSQSDVNGSTTVKGEGETNGDIAPTVELGVNGHTNGGGHEESGQEDEASHDVHIESDHEPELQELADESGEEEQDVAIDENVAVEPDDEKAEEIASEKEEEEEEDEEVEE